MSSIISIGIIVVAVLVGVGIGSLVLKLWRLL
jgi:hypothetical protein